MEPEKMGALIAGERRAKGMTQKDLAEQLNVTDKAVSKWERGLSCPDIALLPRLSELLGVTLGELLSGEKSAASEQMPAAEERQVLDHALQYANRSAHGKIQSWRNLCAILVTAVCVLGGAVCVICDLAICGKLTWSLYPLSSILYAWLICFPVLKCGSKGIVWSLAALSIGLLPFLFALNRILGGVRLLLPIGIGTAAPSLVYLWGVYALFHFLRRRKWLAGALTAAFAIPLEVAINAVLVRLIGEPLMDVWDWLSVLVLAGLAVGFLMVHIRAQGNHAAAGEKERQQDRTGGDRT